MSKNKKLRISSSKLSWLAPTLHGTASDEEPKMLVIRDKILQRDDYTCYYCGFRAEDYQEIHHFNHDHSDYNESNLTTTCPLCHQASHLSTCSQSSGGDIIKLSDDIMTQVEINNLYRMLFICRASGISEWELVSKNIDQMLRTKQSFLEQQISAKSSDPIVFAEVLQGMTEEERNEEYLSNFKLLPRYNRFELAVEYWKDVVFKDMPVSHWKTLLPKSFDLSKIREKVINE